MHKKGHKLKTSPLIKDPQIASNLADIQAKLPTLEAIILTKFHKYWTKIVDFFYWSIFERVLLILLRLYLHNYFNNKGNGSLEKKVLLFQTSNSRR